MTVGADRTRFGTAYFGVRDLEHAAVDLARIADQGFDWILLPFSQDDATWETSTFASLVTMARGHGLQTVVSPWGGAGFGGEGVETGMAIETWLRRAGDTGADILHIDEPRLPGHTLEQVMDLWADDARLWLTIQPDRSGELPLPAVARPAVLGTDAYDGDVATRAAVTEAFARSVGRLDLAWVQAFRIPAGDEPAVGDALLAMAALAPLVGVWAWNGATGRGVLRSDDPGEVQTQVAAAIAAARLVRAA